MQEEFSAVKQELEENVFTSPWFDEVEVRMLIATATAGGSAPGSSRSGHATEDGGNGADDWLHQCRDW